MGLLRVINDDGLVAPTMVVAFDAGVDAGSASTLAVGALIDEDAPIVAEFDADRLFDYRARRPTLDIVNGRPSHLHWPALVVRKTRLGERDILVFTGPEPDFRWRELADDVVAFARSVEIDQWISLGAIPAAVPHTRPVPILGTESSTGLLRGSVEAGPRGRLRVPSAAISVLDVAMAEAGIPSLGYFAQIPHYVSGEYAPGAVALLDAVTNHLGVRVEAVALRAEAEQLRARLDTATSLDEKTRSYVARLEEQVDESGLPAGDELISEIERFLRDQGNAPGQGLIQ
jgi:hypothetical protein